MRTVSRLLAGGAIALVMLLSAGFARAQDMPTLPLDALKEITAEDGAKNLDNLLKNADKIQNSDIDDLMNEQMDKAMVREQAKAAARANKTTAQPGKVMPKTTPLAPTDLGKRPAGTSAEVTPKLPPPTTVDPDSVDGDFPTIPSTIQIKPGDPAAPDKELTEEDLQKTYQNMGKAVKNVRHPLKPNGTMIAFAVLGAGVMLALLSVALIRTLARSAASAMVSAEYDERPTKAPAVRYSWYYREAMARVPTPARSGRKR